MDLPPPTPTAFGPAPYYPDSDGEPMAETPTHADAMIDLIATLRYHYRDRPEVYVVGNVFWYFEEGNPLARKAPDLMVVKNVEAGAKYRGSFKGWVEKASPCFIVEVTSEGTAAEDREEKFALYERLGVHEYFLFDPLREYLEPPLQGYRRIGGHYEPIIPGADGSLPSVELSLRLRADGDTLALIDMVTGQRLPTPAEAYELIGDLRDRMRETQLVLEQERRAREAAQTRADQEHREREVAERRTEQERRERETAEARAEQERREREAAQARAEEARREAQAAEARAQEAWREWEAAQAHTEQERREREAAQARAEQERREREAAQARAEQERREREAAQARAEALAAEIARLRTLLPPESPPPGGAG